MKAAVLSCLALLLVGCATAPAPTALVPTVIPCRSAQDLPDEPARTLNLDASKPGVAVNEYRANRREWIGYADALRSRLEACK